MKKLFSVLEELAHEVKSINFEDEIITVDLPSRVFYQVKQYFYDNLRAMQVEPKQDYSDDPICIFTSAGKVVIKEGKGINIINEGAIDAN